MFGVNGSTYSTIVSPAAISPQSRLCSESSFSGRCNTRANADRNAAQRVRRETGEGMGFGVKSGSNAFWVSASSYQIGSFAGGMDGLHTDHGGLEVRCYTVNRRELRLGTRQP